MYSSDSGKVNIFGRSDFVWPRVGRLQGTPPGTLSSDGTRSLLRHVIFFICCAFLASCSSPDDSGNPGTNDRSVPGASDSTPSATPPQTIQELRLRQARNDEEYWAAEVQSEVYRGTIVDLWDGLWRSTDRWGFLADRAFAKVAPGRIGSTTDLGNGLIRRELVSADTPEQVLDAEAWKGWMRDLSARYELEYFELIPIDFKDANPAISVFDVTLGLAPDPKSVETRRIQVRAEIAVTWSAEKDSYLNYQPALIELVSGEWLEWNGEAPFQEALLHDIPGHKTIPPICIYDLDDDGLSDILYPQTNTLFHNQGDFEFEKTDFCSFPLNNYYDALIADFDGDGRRDLLAAGMGEGDSGNRPSLYLYSTGGEDAAADPLRFPDPPERVYDATFESQLCFAAGDIDGDGDLDLYIGKYLPPFIGGQVPTPFHDSNDGLPADLLINDGTGRFTQGIEGSGLEGNRRRRTFRVSFFDMDGDNDLDLLQTNDFAGTAIFWNDGTGKFTEAPGGGVDESANFGMSHTFGDYDRDGVADFYVTGMYSHTVRRLEAMGLGRPDRPDIDDHRMAIAYGNRMYMGSSNGFAQPPFKDSAANTGWSWGVTSFDPDNDGDLDLFVANGHISGESIRDFDSSYWRHDVYFTGSKPDALKNAFFLERMSQLGKSVSWAGYEHNRLLVNTPDGFISAGFALGVADYLDSRHVISEDFDGDGRTDLLVGFKDGLGNRKGFRVYRNEWPDAGDWIGVVLEPAAKHSVFGATIRVETNRGPMVQVVVAGDSFFSQHSNRRVFGLGKEESVQRIVVEWPDGEETVVDAPREGRYVTVKAPA